MAKKKPVAKKKPTASAKKATTVKKKPAIAKTKAKDMPKKTSAVKNTAPVTQKDLAVSGSHEKNIELLSPDTFFNIMENMRNLFDDFQSMAENNLSALQRRRKIGAGIRNYGFIDKVSDLASANPQYAQFFNISDLKNAIRNIEMCRDLVVLLQSFSRAVSNTMMVYSDDAFTMALIYYNMVKEMSRRGDPQAMEIFRALQPFFRRPRRSSAEPTIKETERDIHAILTHKKDGKVVVEGVAPKKSAGALKVVDEVRKGRSAVKGSFEESEKE